MSDTTLIGIILCAFTYCAAWWHETTYDAEHLEADFPRAWVHRG